MDGNFGPIERVIWPTSVISGIVMCKLVYEFIGWISRGYLKSYNSLSKSTMHEWNNRGFSTFHAILAAAISFYLLVLSDLFKEGSENGFIVDRKSVLSDSLLGFSAGYFLADLGMILWCFPSLGGVEYIMHHGISIYSIILSLINGTAQFYILIILFSEITTPFVNLRWYLDVYGKKSSKLYIYNGVALFLGWLVARVILFIFFFAHIYVHFDQVRTIFPLGFYSLLTAPPLLAFMNVYWFWKITKGMVKTLSQKRHAQ
ncbi:hypothetical protein HPP92_019765 [Vanilla planifolia]|uniref:TLC domain-containing protein n=1 Tax=Vanilla planifolia TaxID=51239 RepID=A0A835Q3W9_VANPL|nr:hypothetical protein HPP92_019765 [Vanilla planifolia]